MLNDNVVVIIVAGVVVVIGVVAIIIFVIGFVLFLFFATYHFYRRRSVVVASRGVFISSTQRRCSLFLLATTCVCGHDFWPWSEFMRPRLNVHSEVVACRHSVPYVELYVCSIS